MVAAKTIAFEVALDDLEIEWHYSGEQRDKDKHSLRFYQFWSRTGLKGNWQSFLAEVKGTEFHLFSQLKALGKKVVGGGGGEATPAEVATVPVEEKGEA